MTEPIAIRPSQRDSLREERLEILRLLESGGISVEETATLLDALDRALPPLPSIGAAPRGPEVRLVRIRITESSSGKSMVNAAFPLALIKTGLDLAEEYGAEYLPDVAAIKESISAGFRGALIDIDDGGQRVEIIAE